MLSYILRRLLLVVPTLWAIITINFFIIQIAPGGPVEQAIAQLEGNTSGVMERFTGGGQEVARMRRFLVIKVHVDLIRKWSKRSPVVLVLISPSMNAISRCLRITPRLILVKAYFVAAM
ncbi:peptide ABC transporter permease [Vibrio cholerae]|nr:peptide ABC transporter permease [Vibrio cholerae]